MNKPEGVIEELQKRYNESLKVEVTNKDGRYVQVDVFLDGERVWGKRGAVLENGIIIW